MEGRIQILTELKQIAPILGKNDLSRVPYRAPSGYFADFTEMLMNRIRLEATGFSDTAQQEIEEISPLLAGIQHKNPYQVPEGFFESLKTKITVTGAEISIKGSVSNEPVKKNLVTPAGKRVVSMPVRIMRYAAAACIVALIGITAFNITYHRNITDPIMALTNVNIQEMANFLDDDDIHWTPGINSSAEIASTDFNDDDIHDLLRGVPDIELEQYSSSLPTQKGTVN